MPGPGRTEHEERLSEGSEGSEGGQSQDTITRITREKRLAGPEGLVTYQIQRTSQDVRESRIQEAANEEFKEFKGRYGARGKLPILFKVRHKRMIV